VSCHISHVILKPLVPSSFFQLPKGSENACLDIEVDEQYETYSKQLPKPVRISFTAKISVVINN
jgi:hypothetical protein